MILWHLIAIYQSTWHTIPEDVNLQQHHCEDILSLKITNLSVTPFSSFGVQGDIAHCIGCIMYINIEMVGFQLISSNQQNRQWGRQELAAAADQGGSRRGGR